MRPVPHSYAGTKNEFCFHKRGRWFEADPLVAQYGNYFTCVANRLYAVPVYIGEDLIIDGIGTYVGSGISGGKVRFGIYASDIKNICLPGKLIFQTPEMPAETNYVDVFYAWYWSIACDGKMLRLKGGKVYWMSLLTNAAISIAGQYLPNYYLGLVGVESGSTPQGVQYVYSDLTYGSLPSTFPSWAFGSYLLDSQYRHPTISFRVTAGDSIPTLSLKLTPASVYVGRWGGPGGYIGGGVGYSEIDFFEFSSEYRIDLSAVLADGARGRMASVNSSTRGYWMGGGDVNNNKNVIDGIRFDTEAAINPSSTLAVARRNTRGVNSSTRGYAGGGRNEGGSGGTTQVVSEIDGIQFSDETAINPSAILAVARADIAGVNSDIRGYFLGGSDATNSTNYDEIDGIQFSDETAINPAAVLVTARRWLGDVNSSTRGYCAGGYSSSMSSEIDGIQFSDETQINPSITLVTSRNQLSGVNSDVKGYWIGGYNGSAQVGDIDGINFSDETQLNPTASLVTARMNSGGLQSGGYL